MTAVRLMLRRRDFLLLIVPVASIAWQWLRHNSYSQKTPRDVSALLLESCGPFGAELRATSDAETA